VREPLLAGGIGKAQILHFKGVLAFCVYERRVRGALKAETEKEGNPEEVGARSKLRAFRTEVRRRVFYSGNRLNQNTRIDSVGHCATERPHLMAEAFNEWRRRGEIAVTKDLKWET